MKIGLKEVCKQIHKTSVDKMYNLLGNAVAPSYCMQLKKLNLYLFGFVLWMLIINEGWAYVGAVGTVSLPVPLDAYEDKHIESIVGKLVFRVRQQPFDLVATLIFFCAVIHTFMVGTFRKLSRKYDREHQERLKEMKWPDGKKNVCFKAELCGFLGEVEAIFGMWVVPLLVAIMIFFNWDTAVNYIDGSVSFLEPVFVVVIMVIASTRPIVKLAEKSLHFIAQWGKGTPAAWWFSILIIAPLFGSLITEPAAMAIGAMLLSRQFYELKPSNALKYGTLGLLFTNVSVGGTLTNFAAPPVLMIASKWGWDSLFMLKNFGYKVVVGIVLSCIMYHCIFRKEFKELKKKEKEMELQINEDNGTIPIFITVIHLCFLGWTVWNIHHAPLVIGGFLFFLAFTHLTLHHQYETKIKEPLLVGFFLAGLVIHGGLQQWWLEPVLTSLEKTPLFLGSVFLTAFNDNAAITYLVSHVPSFSGNIALQKAVVYGAVIGGGLTVIANAPNPAGLSILGHHFGTGVSLPKLFLAALLPAFVMGLSLVLLP